MNSFYTGPIALLSLIYLDRTKCKKFDVERRRPAILGWTMDKMKKKEEAEIEYCDGFGKGELEKEFTPQKIKERTHEEYVIKLKYMQKWLKNDKEQFEKTWLEAESLNEGTEIMQKLRAKHDILFSETWVNFEESQKQDKDSESEDDKEKKEKRN